MNPLFGPLFDVIGKVVDRVIPDKQQAAQVQFETFKLLHATEDKTLEAEWKLALAQLEVNKAEALSPDFFRGGWRPAVGWICALGLGYQILARPLLAWSSTIQGWQVPPALEMETLLTLLFGMLGLGAYRSYERVRGVTPPGR